MALKYNIISIIFINHYTLPYLLSLHSGRSSRGFPITFLLTSIVSLIRAISPAHHSLIDSTTVLLLAELSLPCV
jgi:hypothetical protein